MKYNEEIRRKYGISVSLVSENTFALRLIITIDNCTITHAISKSFLEDIKTSSLKFQEVVDGMIDSEIVNNAKFKKIIRRKKLEHINDTI